MFKEVAAIDNQHEPILQGFLGRYIIFLFILWGVIFNKNCI